VRGEGADRSEAAARERQGREDRDLTLCVTPAMEAGVTDHIWTVEEILALLD
jgi:hypothetical protein